MMIEILDALSWRLTGHRLLRTTVWIFHSVSKFGPTPAMTSLSPMWTSLLRSKIRLPNARSYHSSTHPHAPSYTPVQHKILSASLALVPSTGFTSQTLADGAKQAGYLEITHNLFPRGSWSLIEYHLVRQRESLSSLPLQEGAGVGKTIRTLCVERLKANKDIIGRWQEVYSSGFGRLMAGACGYGSARECDEFTG